MTRQPKLLIIDPAMEVPEEQGVASVLHDWPGESRVVYPSLRGDGPRADDGYDDIDGVVVFGSASSVYDASEWLAELKAWLTPLVTGERELPLFGICYGHQLIADIAGARIGYLRKDQSKLRAYEESVVGGRLLGEPTSLRVICSHREEVKDVPEGFVVTGHRPNSLRDALEHEHLPVFSVQFHPEARDGFAGRIGLDVAGVDERLKASSQRLLGAFRDVALRHHRAHVG